MPSLDAGDPNRSMSCLSKRTAWPQATIPTGSSCGEALEALPPRMRACLSLHYYAGLSVAETAAALGISPNTAKYHLKAGLERLRAALEVEPMRAILPGSEG
jgi:DNA-binding NarL/FixJ family response regulator